MRIFQVWYSLHSLMIPTSRFYKRHLIQFLHQLELLWLGNPNKVDQENFHDSPHLKIAGGQCSFAPNSARRKGILITQVVLDQQSLSTNI